MGENIGENELLTTMRKELNHAKREKSVPGGRAFSIENPLISGLSGSGDEFHNWQNLTKRIVQEQ
ncbi:MAG: hypothetical protein V9H26_09150 [Verrucomicrobiota bacterium]|nr:hypothetical protein [Verrucomicrobiota bacterium]MCC6819212.1 hypothetical protein [Limisphaerales bacterium]